VNSHGRDVAQVWQQIRAGKSGIRRLQKWDPTDLETQIGGEVLYPVDVPQTVGPYPITEGALAYTLGAAVDALAMAGLEPDPASRNRRAVVLASGLGPDTLELYGHVASRFFGPDSNIRRDSLRDFYPMQQADPWADQLDGFTLEHAGPALSVLLGADSVYNTASACASGSQAIADGGALIRRGESDIALVGGVCTALNKAMVPGFAKIKALSNRNDEPEKASRPFDADRDGFVMGEGAALLVLEEREHALARGATILAELLGWGYSCDAYRLTDPEPEGRGMALAMTRALEDSGVSPEELDYVNAHGTSTAYNDAAETLAIKKALGDERAHQIPVSSTKSMTGHLVQGAGTIEAIFCVKALEDQVAPPTINYETPDPACDLDYIPNQARALDLKVVMSNSFGFGGQNAVVVLAHPERA